MQTVPEKIEGVIKCKREVVAILALHQFIYSNFRFHICKLKEISNNKLLTQGKEAVV